jgi:hypothetical protein
MAIFYLLEIMIDMIFVTYVYWNISDATIFGRFLHSSSGFDIFFCMQFNVYFIYCYDIIAHCILHVRSQPGDVKVAAL